VTGTKDTGSLDGKREYIAKAIRNGRIKSNAQVSVALKYTKGLKGEIDEKAFDRECGVGRKLQLFGLFDRNKLAQRTVGI
jgi:glutaminyl-tRNA synthetase